MDQEDLDLKRWCEESRELIAGFHNDVKVCEALVRILEEFPDEFCNARHAEVLAKGRKRLESLKAEETIIAILEDITRDIEATFSWDAAGPGPEGPGGQPQIQEQSGAAPTGEGGEGETLGGSSGPGDPAPVFTPLRDAGDAGLHVSYPSQ